MLGQVGHELTQHHLGVLQLVAQRAAHQQVVTHQFDQGPGHDRFPVRGQGRASVPKRDRSVLAYTAVVAGLA